MLSRRVKPSQTKSNGDVVFCTRGSLANTDVGSCQSSVPSSR